MKTLPSKQFSQAQKVSIWLAGFLGLALFLSPIQLHNNPASVFFDIQTSVHQNHTSHHQQVPNQETQVIRCLRCVLYGFLLPEVIAPLIITLVILGILKLLKLIAPYTFVSLTISARAPPVRF